MWQDKDNHLATLQSEMDHGSWAKFQLELPRSEFSCPPLSGLGKYDYRLHPTETVTGVGVSSPQREGADG